VDCYLWEGEEGRDGDEGMFLMVFIYIKELEQ
jgi:hypothetical protein